MQVHREHGVIVDRSHQAVMHVDGEHVAIGHVLIPRRNVHGVQTPRTAALAQRLDFGDLTSRDAAKRHGVITALVAITSYIQLICQQLTHENFGPMLALMGILQRNVRRRLFVSSSKRQSVCSMS